MRLIAKAAGLISTPLIIEIILYLSGMAIILSGIKQIGKFINEVKIGLVEIKNLGKRIDSIDNKLDFMSKDINNLDKRITLVESKI